MENLSSKSLRIGRELELKTVCECEYPIIRQDLTEYCSICEQEVK